MTDDEGDDDDEETRVVARPNRGDDDDHTVVIERAAPADADPVDSTVAIARRPRAESDPRGAAAPVSQSGRQAVRPSGPNALEIYPARPVRPAPLGAPEVPRGEEPRRVQSSGLQSVARSSRTAGVATLLAFAASCVVSAVGIVAVIVWFARG